MRETKAMPVLTWTTARKATIDLLVDNGKKKDETHEYTFHISGNGPYRVTVECLEVVILNHYEHPPLSSLDAAHLYIKALMNAIAFYRGGEWQDYPF